LLPGVVERLDESCVVPLLEPPGERPMLPLEPDEEPPEAEEPDEPPPAPSWPQPASVPASANVNAATNAVTFMLTSMVGNALEREQGMDREDAPFTRVVLYTGSDGRAGFREEPLALREGTPQARLSAILPATGYQLRRSPIGFRSEFHCTPKPQWVFILAGEMEIGVRDGAPRVFRPGEHFFSADTLPAGASFDPALHGHWSAQRGPRALQTLFLKP
jgi:hypothetical protein